ncbi:XRE family transcriptional regulator [Streptomyces sp. NBC_01435]|uniref:XRE family transcriptional regulator n=1 Tax=Streptomyces sp. NBC_01435 TaxID=2903865 RepID=UPI002E2FB45A|nr:XRE family transcriptional regulator [Streptomyces sp. NBC_01435]
MTTEAVRHPLTYVRRQRGWSMEKLAHHLNLAAQRRGLRIAADRSRIYRWEHRRVGAPSDLYQELLADVLGIDSARLRTVAWPWWLPAYDRPFLFSPAGARAAHTELLVDLDQPDRRTFLVLAAGSLVGMATEWARVEPERLAGALAGRRVDESLLTWLESSVERLPGLANTSPQECADLLGAAMRVAISLLGSARYDEPTGRRLHTVLAQAAQSAAWLHFDQGRHASAQHHWRTALHSAHSADNRDLGAGVLSDLAYSATWLGHPGEAVEILSLARTRTRHATARALLDVRRARALAVLQDDAGTAHALNEAEHQLERGKAQSAPAWVSWMSSADLAVDAGRCWLDLEDPRRATAALEEGLSLLVPERERTRAIMLTYRAQAALAGRDVDAAVTDTRTALDTALRTGASRCLDLVRSTLRESLEPHRGKAAVRDLRSYAHQRLTFVRA